MVARHRPAIPNAASDAIHWKELPILATLILLDPQLRSSPPLLRELPVTLVRKLPVTHHLQDLVPSSHLAGLAQLPPPLTISRVYLTEEYPELNVKDPVRELSGNVHGRAVVRPLCCSSARSHCNNAAKANRTLSSNACVRPWCENDLASPVLN